MSRVQAAGIEFGVDEYEENPTAFSSSLEKAKVHPGHAVCLCSDQHPNLVIRRVSSQAGDRFFLATWPHTGTQHGQDCRFYHSEDEYEAGQVRRLAAITSSADGFSIRADFSLVRGTQAAQESTRLAAEASSPPSRVQRDTMGLLGTLEFLWQSADLNRWMSHYPQASSQRWSSLVTRLQSALAQGRLGGRQMLDITYVVPAYRPEEQDTINARLQSMMDAHRPTGASVSAFLVLGEVMAVEESIKMLAICIKHQAKRLWIGRQLAEAVARRYPSAEAILNAPNTGGRVVGLFLVEVTPKGGLWVKDAALMACSREYIPCDSGYEVRIANVLTQQARSFIKPLRLEDGQDVLPDFKLLDCGHPTVMEVWGMNTPEYLAHRQIKCERYQKLGVVLWEWDAVKSSSPPPLPVPALGSVEKTRQQPEFGAKV
jgi:hypothetical protein